MGKVTIWTPNGRRTKRLDDVDLVHCGNGAASFIRDGGDQPGRWYVIGVPWVFRGDDELPHLVSEIMDHGNLLLIAVSGTVLMRINGVVWMSPQSDGVHLVQAHDMESREDVEYPNHCWAREVVVSGPLVSSSLGPGKSTT